MLYRVQQFVKAVTARLSEEDLAFVSKYLNEQEQQLFYKLKRYEQRHCIDVAKMMGNWVGEDAYMIRLGLLHDIGKIKYPLTIIEKSIIVILDRISHSKIKHYSKLKMVKCYYEHPRLGYELLKQSGDYEEGFLEVILKHHEEESENPKLKWLQKADNLC